MLFQHGKCRAVCTNPKCIAHKKCVGKLVKNGKQRNGEQRYKCKICGKTCNMWSHTPARGVHSKDTFLRVAREFSSGGTIADISARENLRKDTVIIWLLRLGTWCHAFSKANLHGIAAHFIQLDEIMSWVGRKCRTAWIWQSIDVGSKLWLAAHVSENRNQHSCNWFVSKTADTVKENSTLIVTSDGMLSYVHAVLSKFKSAIYAQVIKHYEGRRLVSVEKRVLTREPLDKVEALIQRLSGGKTVNTSFTERLNATIRRMIGRLARKTLCFSRSKRCLEASVYIAQVAYNFVRVHRSLNKTPAHAAGLCESQLSWLDIICTPL